MKKLIGLMVCSLATVACTVLATGQAGGRLVLNDLAIWPEAVEETSGIALLGQTIWTLNDSGDKPRLYGMNAAGEVASRITVRGARNVDWEDLAQDSEYLYIADSGNNFARRKSFSLYRVAVSDLSGAGAKGEVSASQIKLAYRDFAESVVSSREHNVDSEALTKVGEELWLFTKNRQDHQTKLYRFDFNDGDQQLDPVASYPVDGLITSADYNPDTGMMALLGYRAATFFGQAFLWVAPVANGQLDWTQARYWDLEPAGQWEAVVWKSGTEVWMSTERNPLTINKIAVVDLPL